MHLFIMQRNTHKKLINVVGEIGGVGRSGGGRGVNLSKYPFSCFLIFEM